MSFAKMNVKFLNRRIMFRKGSREKLSSNWDNLSFYLAQLRSNLGLFSSSYAKLRLNLAQLASDVAQLCSNPELSFS